MRKETMLKIMAGGMQDAQMVANHIWEQTECPMDILESICRLQEISCWEEYCETAIPFILNLVKATPCKTTQKYIGRNGGKKAQLYAGAFAMMVQTLYANDLVYGMRLDYTEDEGDEESLEGGKFSANDEKTEMEEA